MTSLKLSELSQKLNEHFEKNLEVGNEEGYRTFSQQYSEFLLER